MSKPMTDPVPRAMAKVTVDSDTGCWVFSGGRNNKGYGLIWAYGRKHLTHRLLYELIREPVPAGLVLDHLCMNVTRVNPWHLEAVTSSENIRRGHRARPRAPKTHCKRGHAFTPENTYHWYRRSVDATERQCRACREVWKQSRRGAAA